MRNGEIKRDTKETQVNLWLELDGDRNSKIETGCGFLDHMMTLLAYHAGFDMMLDASGDVYVDDHHLVEDVGICFGKAFQEAIGDKKGIERYGDSITPMDEALIMTAVDISGRAYLVFDVDIPTEKVGTFDTELVEEFLRAFASNAGVTLHVKMLEGKNSHHIIEGVFKSLARTLKKAVKVDEEDFSQPSTKGLIE